MLQATTLPLDKVSPPLGSALIKRARKRLLQMHFESGVGHIGGNLSVLDSLLLLCHEYVGANDSLILSKGHAAGALYIALWTKGLLSDNSLKLFHKDGTVLAGHPPAKGIPAIPFATGSLGHGLSLAAGTALAKRLTHKDGHVFCVTSDGEWQEGSTWEALIFACHHQLNKLTILVDHNGLQGFGSTDGVASMNPLADKLRGFNLEMEQIDGHDVQALRQALNRPNQRPKLLILKTVKGHGVRFMEDQMEWHYLPLNHEQYQQALQDVEAA